MIEILNNEIKFRVSAFLKMQEKILWKYQDKEKFLQDMTGDKFIKEYDKYLMQILEELHFEFFEEQSKEEDKEDIVKEFIDAIMYTGSTLCLVKSLVDVTIEEDLTINLFRGCLDSTSSSDNICDISYTLMKVRRMFPERKWHKNEATTDYNRIETAVALLMEALEKELVYLASISRYLGMTDRMLAELFITKQGYILNL